MPGVRRSLYLAEKENVTPAKRFAPDRTYSPTTGTCYMSPASSSSATSRAKGRADNSSDRQKTSSDAEKLNLLQAKVLGSIKAIEKARKEIGKALPAECSSELVSYFRRGSADLQTELTKNKELFMLLKTRPCVTETARKDVAGFEKPASSYEFLKSILT